MMIVVKFVESFEGGGRGKTVVEPAVACSVLIVVALAALTQAGGAYARVIGVAGNALGHQPNVLDNINR